MLHRPLLLALFVSIASARADAGTVYVHGALASGAGDGTSWSDAFRGADAVARAMDAAQPGDEIWVVAGTYVPTTTTSRTATHALRSGIAVYGGFLGTETQLAQRDPDAHVTTLSGSIGVPSTPDDDSLHVVSALATDATAILDGFTVRDGRAGSSGSPDFGGGLLCVGGIGPSIQNCIFTANRAFGGGGAVAIDGSSPRFVNVHFDGNYGNTSGGAVYARGSSSTYARCSFRQNYAGNGGALMLAFGGAPRFVSCLLFDNHAESRGGAIWTGGGATPSIQNCTFHQNSAPYDGDGLFAQSGLASVANCIFWRDGHFFAGEIVGPADVTWSIVEGGHPGVGNRNVDPLFGPDLALTIDSPAIDAGDNAAVSSEFDMDLAGLARRADEPTVADTGLGTAPVVDLGCSEFAPSIRAFCAGDGSAAPCPCGNESPSGGGAGCLHSFGTGGSASATGRPRILSDTLVLHGAGMTNGSCLWFQGTTQLADGNGVAFGDGLRCAGGTVTRLATKTNVAGASQFPGAGDPPVSIRGGVDTGGSVRTYQCWYRNSAAFCTSATFNLTNALWVTWEL